MIPQSAITQWSEFVPWKSNAQIEQDLIICRAIVTIFNDEYLVSHLAFRGGTALHKLYLHPQPRFSEDLDFVQINAEPIKETLDRIRELLSFLGEPKIKQNIHNNTLIFHFNSEIPPISPLRLKVEINCREHFHVLGFTHRDFGVSNQWFSGNCKITTYHLEELLGTKLRALYQRRKGRDLFDLYKALSTQKVCIEKLILCYRKYIGSAVENPPTAKEYLRNMELKMRDKDFLGDTCQLLRPDNPYDPIEAWRQLKGIIEGI
jgi:predicted nucleotidyltransferase component of viral defense system